MRAAGELRVGITGAAGRMGRTLVQFCQVSSDIELGAAFEAPGNSHVGLDAGAVAGIGTNGVPIGDDVGAAADRFDVLIDFTRADASLPLLRSCVNAGKRAVVGTTGFDAGQRDEIRSLAEQAAIVLAPNMSVGVNVCLKLLDVAARALGDDFDVEVIEAHHRNKVDAPSGTAVRMGEVLADALGRDLSKTAVYAREGHTGPRPSKAIGFQTVRAGDIVGEHTVLFAGTGERIEVTHRASSRGNFALGALRASLWVRDRDRGLYDMHDVLGLRQ